MINDWLKEQIILEKSRKQADDQRIFNNLQVYAYVCGIDLYALNLIKSWGICSIIGSALIISSFIFWVLSILIWKKSFFNYRYEHEAPISNIRNREIEVKEHYSSHSQNSQEIENLTKQFIEKEILEGAEKVHNSYHSNNKKRAELFSESNNYVFYSFMCSLIATIILKICDVMTG